MATGEPCRTNPVIKKSVAVPQVEQTLGITCSQGQWKMLLVSSKVYLPLWLARVQVMGKAVPLSFTSGRQISWPSSGYLGMFAVIFRSSGLSEPPI